MCKEAMHWEKLEGDDVRCLLCPHRCIIRCGKTGLCRVRHNAGGCLQTAVYGRVSAVAMDPVEKKPLYHFHPGAMILSLGQAGCTFHCDFCQNYHLLAPDIRMQPMPCGTAVELAVSRNSFAIAYTYNEPWVGYEYVLDTAQAARRAGLKNVLVTNGYYSKAPFEKLAPLIDAMNIDLKSIRDDFYRRWTRGRLGPVKRTIERALELGIHVELTNLLVTGLNDSEEDVRDLASYAAGLDSGLPLHLSRYHPAYRMDRPPTPLENLVRAYETASERLDYVYLGNVTGSGGADSICPGCSGLLVSRSGFSVRLEALESGRCRDCGKEVNFVM